MMYRRPGDKTQENCKQEFILSISVTALTYSQKTSILLQAQLPAKGISQAIYFTSQGVPVFSCVNQSISQFINYKSRRRWYPMRNSVMMDLKEAFYDWTRKKPQAKQPSHCSMTWNWGDISENVRIRTSNNLPPHKSNGKKKRQKLSESPLSEHQILTKEM